MRVLDRGQRTCVNTNINGTAGSISIIVEKTCAAQHTGCSGLGWPGLGWPRAPTFSPHWLTDCQPEQPGVTVWPSSLPPARQIFKWPKFASPTWWVTSPCFVISCSISLSFLISNISHIYKDIRVWREDDWDCWWQGDGGGDDAENPAYTAEYHLYNFKRISHRCFLTNVDADGRDKA